MYLLSFLISHFFLVASASNILLLTPPVTKYASKSHADNMIILGKELLKSGHDVSLIRQGTVRIDDSGDIDLFDIPSPVTNETVEKIGEVIRKQTIDLMYQNISALSINEYGKIVWNGLLDDCQVMLTDPTVKERIKDFDLLVIDHFFFCGFLLAEKYEKPFVMLECSSYITYYEVSVPGASSWVPAFMSGLNDKMSIVERAKSILSNVFVSMFLTSIDKNFNKLKDEMNIAPGRSLSQIRQKAELFLINSDYIFEFPRPVTHNVIYVGGMLAATPSKDQDINPKIYEITKKKFGIVAFGSALNFCDHPKFLAQIREILENFPDIQWIWSLKCQLDKPYPNIHVFHWIPQKYLLSRENCRIFISHGGLNSLYETMYYGVPALVVPLPMDAIDNSVRLIRHGMLELVSVESTGFPALHEKLSKMLSSDSYYHAAKKVSKMVRDKKPTAAENAVHWIDHVLKFGGKHLRHTAMDMTIYQLYNLDLLVIGIVIILIFLWVLKKIFLFCFLKCCRKFFSKTKKD